MENNVHYKVNYNKIKALAKSKGLKVNQIEKKLGFGTSTIYRWNDTMAGKKHRAPTVSNLYKVAKLLDTSIENLLEEEHIKWIIKQCSVLFQTYLLS